MDVFPYLKQYFGGTEYMAKNFHKNILPNMKNLNKYHCLIMPGEIRPLDKYLKEDKEIIIWMHNTPSQFQENLLFMFKNVKFQEKLKYVIVPSESHKEIVNKETNISLEKIYVIPNAIYPVKSDLSRFNKPKKVKLVYTSAFDRGMPLLMDALNFIENDFELEVYNDFYPDLYEDLPIFDSRIKFFGKTPKSTVVSALSNSHIFAYPTVFIETFCLSLAESMSAGLYPVYPDYGALKEISNEYGSMYDYTEDVVKHIQVHASKLDDAISMILAGEYNPEEQIKYINNKYSWNAIEKKWLEFDSLI